MKRLKINAYWENYSILLSGKKVGTQKIRQNRLTNVDKKLVELHSYFRKKIDVKNV